jgi:hypothetical protein
MLISNFCEYNSLITELVESDVDNFYKKIGMTDRTNLNMGKCLNNILSKGGMSNIKIDSTKELIITKMNIFIKILTDLENNQENKTVNEKNFPKDIVGDFIIINVDHPKKEVRFVTKNVLLKYIRIFGKDILYKLKYFVGSKELNKLFQDSPFLLKIFSEIEEEEKIIEEKKLTVYRNYLEKKFYYNSGTVKYSNNKKIKQLYPINEVNNIKVKKNLLKSSSQPEYKVSKKLKLKPINFKNELNQIKNNDEQNEKKIKNIIKKNKKRKSLDKIDASQISENAKVN